jgi:hypothetical protein
MMLARRAYGAALEHASRQLAERRDPAITQAGAASYREFLPVASENFLVWRERPPP